jgi:hypothetical protein
MGDIESLTGQWYGQGDMILQGTNKFGMHGGSSLPDQDGMVADINDELTCFQQQWHVNTVRILIDVSFWYYDQQYAYWNGNQWIVTTHDDGQGYLFSYRNYVELVAQLAMAKGMYLDFCPYEVLSSYNGSNNHALPTSEAAYFDNPVALKWLKSVNGGNEQQFWIDFWASVDSRLAKYPNVILEAWNEPNVVDHDDPARFAYYNGYLYPMYNQIRNVDHATNLVMMQYYMGVIPGHVDLTYGNEIYALLTNLTVSNLVITEHVYRNWIDTSNIYLNDGWGVHDYSDVSEAMDQLMSTYTAPLPLVSNEMGIWNAFGGGNYYPSSPENTYANALTWWDSILTWDRLHNVGFFGYYFFQSGFWGYPSESLLSDGLLGALPDMATPNSAGIYFIIQAGLVQQPTPISVVQTPSNTPSVLLSQTSTGTFTAPQGLSQKIQQNIEDLSKHDFI